VSRSGGLGIVLICAVALVLRGIGIQYGLPAVYNPDEVAIMSRALSFATGTLNPHNFLYPTFYFYVLFAWVGAYLAFVWMTGGVESLSALPRLYFTNPTGIYTAGRALGVAAGTATVYALYRLAAKLTDSRTAIAAALFLAVAPLAVRDSHYVKHDVPATLAVVIAYLAMCRVWPCAASAPRERDTLLAGAACGMAVSTHYYCVFLTIPLAFAVYQAWRTAGPAAWLRQLLWAGTATIVAFLVLSPFLLVEPLTAWRDITANRQIVIDRAVAGGAFTPVVRYLEMVWKDTAGQPVVALGGIGAVWMMIASPLRSLWLLAFPVPFLVLIANTAPATRYLNPIVPFVAMFAAWTLSRFVGRVTDRPAVFWTAVALAAAPALVSSVRADIFIRQDDTRTLARQYVEAHIPAESTILIQPYSAPLTPSRAGLTEALTRNLGSAGAASTKFRLQLALEPYPSPAYRLLYLGRGGLDQEKIYVDPADLGGSDGLEPLKRLGVAYLIVTRYNRPDPVTLPFLTTLAREGRVIAVFSPYRTSLDAADQRRIDPFLHNTDARIDEALERPGPRLEIWQLK
jgi:4-amino-4-deoxy-L-arabinose transferase-like glycosyltransferase